MKLPSLNQDVKTQMKLPTTYRKQRVYIGGNTLRILDFCDNCKTYSMVHRFCIICGVEI